MACPICERPTVAAFRPFCSKRCADIDLGRWFSGSYAIPADPASDGEIDEDNLPDPDQSKPH